MYLSDARASIALARARDLAESIDDVFNLACTETGQGHLQVALGCQDDGYEILKEGNSKLEALCHSVRHRSSRWLGPPRAWSRLPSMRSRLP